MIYLLVFVAGGAGAVARYLIDSLFKRLWHGSMPVGTFFLNLTGSFLLGVLTGWLAGPIPPAESFVITENITLVVGVGFLGGYTTFSSALLEAAQAPARREVLVLTLGQLLATSLAAAGGLGLGGLFSGA
ncbi:fluoride efflux transporter FluC [Rothia nasimurium]|uniref:fluoride efflux transporter FluC n=3 Tax=Rothia nasimurium TaxID=85336 RepID=UPI001F1BBFC4|nr:CrcB family protein [Rothia nasimurium]